MKQTKLVIVVDFVKNERGPCVEMTEACRNPSAGYHHILHLVCFRHLHMDGLHSDTFVLSE